ncbi:MAG: ABC transporter ATP-binding protein [Acetilactobacillus jinshanensis]
MTKPATLKNPKKLNQLQKKINEINQKNVQVEKQWEQKGTELEERFD